MALNPADITGKSFQTRFRGLDPAEVKGFLELVAGDLAELQDRFREAGETITAQHAQLGRAAETIKGLERRSAECERLAGELRRELGETRTGRATLAGEQDRLKKLVGELERERENLRSESGRLQASLTEAERQARISGAAVEELRRKISLLEAERGGLKREVEGLESALDEARQQGVDLAERGGAEAARLLAGAREEIARLRGEAVHELVGMREEIGRLAARREQAVKDLRSLLEDQLRRLEEVRSGDGSPPRPGFDDLFQKIDLAELAEFEEAEPGPQAEPAAGTEGQEENLKGALRDGGVAYLSDE